MDQPDLVYRTEEAKFDAVVDDIAERHRAGSAGAGRHHLGGEVRVALRAAQEARCAARGAERQAARRRGEVVAHGRPQGRGHCGHQHGRPRHRHHARRLARVPRRPGAAQAGARPGRERRGVRSRLAGRRSSGSPSRSPPSTTRSRTLGGLYVLGTERHESRRIDNQLRGRPAVRATRASPASTSPSRTT